LKLKECRRVATGGGLKYQTGMMAWAQAITAGRLGVLGIGKG